MPQKFFTVQLDLPLMMPMQKRKGGDKTSLDFTENLDDEVNGASAGLSKRQMKKAAKLRAKERRLQRSSGVDVDVSNPTGGVSVEDMPQDTTDEGDATSIASHVVVDVLTVLLA